jgi:hypothetical protein
MLEFLKNLFTKNSQLANISVITGHLADIVSLFETEYMQDKNSFNAAIDTVIKLLEEQKKPQ